VISFLPTAAAPISTDVRPLSAYTITASSAALLTISTLVPLHTAAVVLGAGFCEQAMINAAATTKVLLVIEPP
jgi:hypothetical protein